MSDDTRSAATAAQEPPDPKEAPDPGPVPHGSSRDASRQVVPARIGIDLGTTHSVVAICEDGIPRVLNNALDEPLTPSVVSILGGDVLVGRPARERLLSHPKLTAANFKRDMGLGTTYSLGDHKLSPVELSACVLMSLAADATRALGRPIAEAVITVPAYFDEA